MRINDALKGIKNDTFSLGGNYSMAKNKAKMNKFLTGAITATMVASAVAPLASAAETKNFSDVNADSEFAPFIYDLVDRGIINGYVDGTFKPAQSLTRSNAVKMLARVLEAQGVEAPANWNTVQRFTDVPVNLADQDLVKAAALVKEEGVFNGNINGTLDPLTDISRQHMATVIVRAFDAVYGVNLVDDYKDADFKTAIKDLEKAGEPHRENIIALEYAGMTTVTEYRPTEVVNRAQFSKFLSVGLNHVEEEKVTEGITSVKAVNDTRVLVEFGSAIDRDFVREAELNGKYFTIHTEGNSVQSEGTIQSKAINFAPDGKSATFDLEDGKEIESGKKYIVSLLDGDKPKVSDVVYSYVPTVLKAAADAPGFEVSAAADKIFVKFNAKMKDSAKDVANYTVYDEGSQKLGDLSEFLTADAEGKWVDLNDKNEVEFQLGKDSSKKLQAGKTYKLVVKESVKTDDNKTLSESNRTIKVKTPSIKEASPVAKVARVTAKDAITLYFDQDIVEPDGGINLNKAQLNLKTTTGKTIDVDKFSNAKVVGDNALEISFSEDVFDAGLTYKVDMPANVVQNGIFTNAMNEATTGLTARAQENISIKTMKAEIVADPKNDNKADLILTFDQVPNLDTLTHSDVVLYDGRDKYVLESGAKVKVFGGDTTGKSIIIEDTKEFVHATKGALQIKADESYDVEIAKDALETDTFDDVVKAKNKSKLTATTKGISISAPIIDEVVLQSAEKIEVVFEENIKGNVKASDITVAAFVANRSDIFTGSEEVLKTQEVSGAGYFDVKISGKVLTLTAKTGVKFPTAQENTSVEIDKDVITNSTGKVGNAALTIDKDLKEDFIDNAAPVIVGAHADESGKDVTVTYSEDVKLQGNADDVATLFFTDKGENASEGVKYVANGSNSAVITFKENFWKNDTDLSKVTLKYSQGNSYYIQDNASNKMKTDTLTGFFTKIKEGPEGGDNETPGGNEFALNNLPAAAWEIQDNTATDTWGVVLNHDQLPAELQGADSYTITIDGETYELTKNRFNENKFTGQVSSVKHTETAVKAGVVEKVVAPKFVLGELNTAAFEIQDNTATDTWGVVLNHDQLPTELQGATSYEITIDGETYELTKNRFNANKFTGQVSSIKHTDTEVKTGVITKK